MKKLFGLGKGLGSLIPTQKEIHPQAQDQKENVFYVEVHKIEANPNQPRQDFDEEGMKELAASIRKYGVLQPLLVSKIENKTPRGMDVAYQLIAGERRLRAAKMAGLPHVPVIIRDDFDPGRDRLEVALIENIQRENLNPIEEAEGYDRLSREFNLTHDDIAQKVSKSRVVISNAIRLLKLPEDIKEAVREGRIAKAHARGLVSVTDPQKQREMFEQVLAGAFSSRDIETIVSEIKGSPKKVKRDSRFRELEKNLAETIGAPVAINAGASGGRITIRFADLEELNAIAKSIID